MDAISVAPHLDLYSRKRLAPEIRKVCLHRRAQLLCRHLTPPNFLESVLVSPRTISPPCAQAQQATEDVAQYPRGFLIELHVADTRLTISSRIYASSALFRSSAIQAPDQHDFQTCFFSIVTGTAYQCRKNHLGRILVSLHFPKRPNAVSSFSASPASGAGCSNGNLRSVRASERLLLSFV